MSEGSGLTPYAEMAQLLSSLPLLLREARRHRQLSERAAAKELGVSFMTVRRIEHGEDYRASNAVLILRWLARPGHPDDPDKGGDEA